MGTTIAADPKPATGRLDQELEMVRGGVRMVATGGATRVLVCGLRFGEQVAASLRPEARRAGVALDPLWRLDEHGCDIRVERLV